MDANNQEALARHMTVADVYLHAERAGFHIDVLHEDIDMSGIDLTLVFESTVRPLQLKSRGWSSTTKSWPVRRRIPIPRVSTRLHGVLFRVQDVATEGLGGALLVQDLYYLKDAPHLRVFYRLGMMELVYLRHPERFRDHREKCDGRPKHLNFTDKDLTPPLEMGEVLWLLFGMGSRAGLIGARASPEGYLLSGNEDAVDRARTSLREFEAAVRKRFSSWRRRVQLVKSPRI